jgi:hypothetical protein
MDFVDFSKFAQARRPGCHCVVDACMDAMEEGMLPVITKEGGYYLWEYYILTVDQWVRMCALLQQNRLPSRLLWRWQTYVRWTKRSVLPKPCLVSHVPDAMAALTRIEFLWQDLDAVQAYNISIKSVTSTIDIEWIAVEVARRRQWFAGLRQAWLLAVVIGD